MSTPQQPGNFVPGAFIILLTLAAACIGAAMLGGIQQ